jgi:drug/metabolite transporter (DMT)-like permease
MARKSGGEVVFLGYAAAIGFVSIWGAWIVATRLGVTTTLSPGDLAFIRFVVPSLLLAPMLFRARSRPVNLRAGHAIAMAVGAGAPFFLLAATGMQFAPAAHVGALLPGTMPLFVALLSALLLKERFSTLRKFGFLLILLGDLGIGGYAALVSGDGAWRGHLMFLAAAAMWGIYTLAFRRSGLTPWQGALVVNGLSLVCFLPAYLLFLEPRVLSASPGDLALQILLQGFGSGLVALALFGLAVNRLGASRGSAFTSLAPAIATLLAIPILGETQNVASILGIAGVTVGVALASGAFERAR